MLLSVKVQYGIQKEAIMAIAIPDTFFYFYQAFCQTVRHFPWTSHIFTNTQENGHSVDNHSKKLTSHPNFIKVHKIIRK